MGLTFAGNKENKVLITGSSTIAPLAQEIARQFEKNHEGKKIDVQTGGSTRGVIDARNGFSDLGMVSRDLKSNETDLIKHTIALDGIGIILHKSNSIQVLSEKQIRQIFTGEITNWKEVGGSDQRIVVVNKAEGRSTLELFLKYFSLKPSDIKAHIIIGDNEQGVKTVSVQPYSIGYVSIGTAEYSISNNIPLKLLPLNGVKASVENVRNRSYPLSRQLNLVSKKERSPLVDKFINYALSDKSKDIIKGQYFVPVQ